MPRKPPAGILLLSQPSPTYCRFSGELALPPQSRAASRTRAQVRAVRPKACPPKSLVLSLPVKKNVHKNRQVTDLRSCVLYTQDVCQENCVYVPQCVCVKSRFQYLCEVFPG